MPEMKKTTIEHSNTIGACVKIIPLCYSEPTRHGQMYATNTPTNTVASLEEEFAHSKIAIAEMAKQCNMTSSTFKRKFTDHYGLPPHKWQIKQRLDRAVEMLCATDLLVKQIAYECGFATPSHFVRCFKKEFGHTPETYRKQLKESPHRPSDGWGLL